METSLQTTPIASGTDDKRAKTELLHSTLSKVLEENVLTCDHCEELLRPPVYAVAKVGTVCGSCANDKKTDCNNAGMMMMPLEKFDAILRSMPVVDCTNERCKAHILDGNLDGHLKRHCKYRSVECISVEKCPWTGPLDDLVGHFKEKHQDDVKVAENVEALVFTVNVEKMAASANAGSFVVVSKLLIRESYRFFLLLRMNSVDVFYNMFAVDEEKDVAPVGNVTIKHCGKENLHFTVDIATVAPMNMIDQEITMTDNAVGVKVECLKLISPGQSSDLNLIVNVPISKVEQLMTPHVLELLKCFACRNLIKPPIFLCDKGHSICAKCCWESRQCSVCQETMSVKTKSRNHSLEAITSDMFYPCVNEDRGCQVRIAGRSIADHETKCKYTEYVCPLKMCPRCDYKGDYDGLKQHVSQKHEDVLHANTYRCGLTINTFGKYVNEQMFIGCNIFQIYLRFSGEYNETSCCTVTNFAQPGYQSRSDFRCKISIQGRKTSREMSVTLVLAKDTTQERAHFNLAAFEEKKHFDGETDLDFFAAIEMIDH